MTEDIPGSYRAKTLLNNSFTAKLSQPIKQIVILDWKAFTAWNNLPNYITMIWIFGRRRATEYFLSPWVTETKHSGVFHMNF